MNDLFISNAVTADEVGDDIGHGVKHSQRLAAREVGNIEPGLVDGYINTYIYYTEGQL